MQPHGVKQPQYISFKLRSFFVSSSKNQLTLFYLQNKKMQQERLSNEEFFRKLTELFATTTKKEFGSVFLTQKRLLPPDDKPKEDVLADLELAETPGPVLIRATNGASKNNRDTRKIKFATVVEPEAIEGFYVRYAEVCKTGMTALKKRNRKNKSKKKKATKGTKDGERATA